MYTRSDAGVDIDMNRTTQVGGHAEGDLLVSIEAVIGSGFDDVMRGNSKYDYFVGKDGNDFLDGAGGTDIFYADGGDDTLIGGAGNDPLYGGSGLDTAVFGGTFASYAITDNGDGSCRVEDLRAGSPDGTDTIREIERLTFADGTRALAGVLDVPQGFVAIDAAAVGSYNAAVQDLTPSNFEVLDNGHTLHLWGNTWKALDFSYDVTSGTVLEFDFLGTAEGEIQGIGLDLSGTESPSDPIFELFGTDNYFANRIDDYDLGDGWKHYTIDIGNYYTGQVNYLTFVNNHDVGTPTAESFFRNVQVYDTGGINGSSESDHLSGTTGDDVLFGFAGDDTLTGGSGADRLYGGAGDDILHGDDAAPGYAQVSFEDFEGGASGWSDTTTDATETGAFTEFLGRFSGMAGAQAVSKTFALSGDQDTVQVSFDFYRIDSWDGEHLSIYIDDVAVLTHQLWPGSLNAASSGSFAGGRYSIETLSEDSNLGFRNQGTYDDDAIYRYTLTLDAYTGTVVKLGFGADINGGLGDESWGIDNVSVSVDSTGDDTLEGGAGADTLYGGAGSDTFLFLADTACDAVDTIGHFEAGAGGDVIDIQDLLDLYDPQADSITDFVTLSESGGNTLLAVDADGTGTASTARNVVQLTGLTGLNVQDLITDGNLALPLAA